MDASHFSGSSTRVFNVWTSLYFFFCFLKKIVSFRPRIPRLVLENFFKLFACSLACGERSLLVLPFLSNSAPVCEQNEKLLHWIHNDLYLVEHVLAITPVLNVDLGKDSIVIVSSPIFKDVYSVAVQLTKSAHFGDDTLSRVGTLIMLASFSKLIGVPSNGGGPPPTFSDRGRCGFVVDSRSLDCQVVQAAEVCSQAHPSHPIRSPTFPSNKKFQHFHTTRTRNTRMYKSWI